MKSRDARVVLFVAFQAGSAAAIAAPASVAPAHASGGNFGVVTAPAGTKNRAISPKRLAVAYRRASEEYYLPMAAAQSGLLRGSADALGQFIVHPAAVDPLHVAAMGTLGFLVSGYGGAVWLRHLERKLGSGTAPSDVLRKTFTDYTCWAPCANSAYLFLVPLMTGHGDLADATSALQQGFLSVMLLEASIFMPYNLLAFNSIPAPLRPPSGSLLAAIFTIGFGIISGS